MKLVIAAYVLRYGIDSLLTGIGDGLAYAEQEHSSLTKLGKRQLIKAASAVFQVRNEIQKDEESISTGA